MQAKRTLDLPCPWVPLQSVTTVASRRLPDREELGVKLRGKATHWLEPIGCDSGPGVHARRSADRVFGIGRASPVDNEAGCSIRMRAVHRTWAEASVRHDATSRVTKQTHTSSQRASPEPEPKPGNGCFLDALRVTEATSAAPKLPCRDSRQAERPSRVPSGRG